MYLSIRLAFRNVYIHLYIAKSGSISTVHTAGWISWESASRNLTYFFPGKNNLSWCSIGEKEPFSVYRAHAQRRHLNSKKGVTNKRTLLSKGEQKYVRGDTVAHATRFRAVLQLGGTICEIPRAHMVRHQFRPQRVFMWAWQFDIKISWFFISTFHVN